MKTLHVLRQKQLSIFLKCAPRLVFQGKKTNGLISKYREG